ncbi:MAG: YdeI/OmpD-associated family protein [Actinomycetota bacterium]|nr:YdeI/OmpD-associated family protein [Actinomycetota bacterium]
MTTRSADAPASAISFTAVPEVVGETTLVRLPQEASAQLPSRGQVAVRGVLGGHEAATVLEPDGRRGHWMRVDSVWARAAGVAPSDAVQVVVEVAEDWPEPEVPKDLSDALEAAPVRVRDVWRDITPMARWEWVRWVGATQNAATRQRRVEVSIDKLDHGKRRPCCFDLSSCTDPGVCRSGRLAESATPDAPAGAQPPVVVRQGTRHSS